MNKFHIGQTVFYEKGWDECCYPKLGKINSIIISENLIQYSIIKDHLIEERAIYASFEGLQEQCGKKLEALLTNLKKEAGHDNS